MRTDCIWERRAPATESLQPQRFWLHTKPYASAILPQEQQRQLSRRYSRFMARSLPCDSHLTARPKQRGEKPFLILPPRRKLELRCRTAVHLSTDALCTSISPSLQSASLQVAQASEMQRKSETIWKRSWTTAKKTFLLPRPTSSYRNHHRLRRHKRPNHKKRGQFWNTTVA